ncbi:methyltransferase-like protein 23-like isoform X2 [Hibiscus syriacus]|uniref:Methyltransferase-like protein 23-like isoform X2 n=1 Tax=Hibiscus syriacus TaxID=106335 RepID=A0A6A2ZZ76_HIBSY|nr:methyltransferase-like protein 23-like isoform X2 [Hibiscus syriacus]
MTTISRHFFGDSEKTAFSISIVENMKEDYGLFVWPCSIVLAEYVWQQRSRFSGNDVVELGAGTCLPGLIAAKVGSNVTLTDDANRLEVLENMRTVCDLNKLKCEVLGLTWGVWDASIFSLHPKIILGADVLYDARAGHHLIEFLMVKWGLKCVKLLDGFSLLPSDKATRLSGNIQLAEIVLSHEQIEETSSSGAR